MTMNTSLSIILATIIFMMMMLDTVQGESEGVYTCDYNLEYECGEDGRTYHIVCWLYEYRHPDYGPILRQHACIHLIL